VSQRARPPRPSSRRSSLPWVTLPSSLPCPCMAARAGRRGWALVRASLFVDLFICGFTYIHSLPVQTHQFIDEHRPPDCPPLLLYLQSTHHPPTPAGYCSTPGWQPKMEDTVCVQTPLMDEGIWTGQEEEDGVFAVFDGHQGTYVACDRYRDRPPNSKLKK
jgi:hypothetical protein